MEYLIGLIISVVLNMILFIPAFVFKTDKLTDLSYSLSFIIVSFTLFIINQQNLIKTILLTMIIIWATRLGGYLFIRIRKTKRDKRFDGVREHFWKFFKFWFLQSLSVWVILLPTIYLISKDSLDEISVLSFVGIIIWAVGLFFESVSDYQKYKFINNPNNKDKWIESGLWKYSRHPNYFGEILIWVGVYIFTLSYGSYLNSIINLTSPIFITLLLLYGTGIPTTEKYADNKWGHLKEYKKYKEKTPKLIPFIKN